ENVADEDRLLVREVRRDRFEVEVGHWNDEVLRLTTAKVAQHFAEPERGEVYTLVERTFSAEGAVSAGDVKARDDPITGLEPVDRRPHLFHDTDELMAQQLAR